MSFADFALDGKTALIAVLVLVAVYFSHALLKLLRLPRASTHAPAPPVTRAASEPEQPSYDPPTVPGYSVDIELFADEPPSAEANVAEAAAPASPGMDAQPDPQERRDAAGFEALEARIATLEGVVEELSGRIALLGASASIAPQYSEALSLAARGFDADTIASQCDMSVGEAELVLALAQRQQQAVKGNGT